MARGKRQVRDSRRREGISQRRSGVSVGTGIRGHGRAGARNMAAGAGGQGGVLWTLNPKASEGGNSDLPSM